MKKLLLYSVAVLAFPFLATPQDATGKILGIVKDASGAVIPRVSLTITNVGTNISRETTTDDNGVYQVLQLPIGRYKVEANATGFRKLTVDTKADLEINQTLRIDITMEVGQQTQSVVVESQATQVETAEAVVGATVSTQAIAELPLNGRNTLDLLKTQPGVTPTNPDSGAAGSYSIGGQRTDSITFLLDGGLNNSLLSNAVVANPNPDAIAEFRVLESNYSAEYGRNAGGIVSVVTKSGTNSLHGSVFEYLRNDFFDANSFFNNQQGLATPILKRNQFGGTIGGPIILPKIINGKNKLFFFFSYQGQRQTALDQSPGKINTYTPAQAAGNFSQAFAPGQPNLVAQFLQANPQYQSNQALAAQGIIDPSKIDPVAQAYFKAGLIPTSASGFLFPQASQTANFNEYLGKFDYNLTSHDVISGTFTSRDFPTLYPFGNVTGTASSFIGFPSTSSDTTYFGAVTYTHTFTPSLLNELRVTAQRLNHTQAIPASSQPTAAQLGVEITPDQSTGPPRIGFLGSGPSVGFSPQGPTNEIDNTYAFYDNFSWNKGSHNFKFGFFFSPYQNNTVYDFYVNGEFFFYGPSTGVGSGLDLADFLLGLPDEFLQFGKAPSNIRSQSYAGYAQDQWRATKRLTLTLGLRYEYAQPKFDTQGRSFSFIPGLQSQRFPNAPTGLVFPGDRGAPTGSNFPDKNDWAPRFGFAYDVFGNAKTSVRGGVGMFYDILKGEDNLQYNGQAPFFGFADVFPSGPTPGALSGLQDPYGSSGAVNPFPSKTPAKNIDFNAAGFLPFGGGGVFFVDPHLRTPYVFQYNLSVQQELAHSMVLEVSYLGYSAHKLTSLVDVNPFILGTSNRLYGKSNFSYLDQFQNVSKANYNGMTVNLRRRFANMGRWGSSFFTLGYTWSHEIDNVSGFRQRNSDVPYYNHDQFRASGDTDVRNAFVFSGGWDLPFDELWNHGPKALTRGWSLYPILTARTGFPLDVFANLSTSRNDPGPSGAGDASYVRADLVGNSIGILNPQTFQTIGGSGGNYYFNPGNFSVDRINALDAIARSNPASLPGYTYGSLPRNSFRGPGQTNLDLSLAKHFKVGERFDGELRLDAFNVFNHTEFKNPDTTATDATFGQISTTYDPRILQLAIHIRF